MDDRIESSDQVPAKAILLLSGGLDSCVLAAYMARQGIQMSAIAFDYGQRHRRELDSAIKIAKSIEIPLHVLDMRWFASLLSNSSQTNNAIDVPHGHYAAEQMKITVVSNRNMVMLSIAAAHALGIGADAIAIAAHAGDHTIYPDCRDEFMQAFIACVRLGNWGAESLHLYRPFINASKADIVALGNALGAPMHLSYSCYKGAAMHCGYCGTCIERREAFALAGIQDNTEYGNAD